MGASGNPAKKAATKKTAAKKPAAKKTAPKRPTAPMQVSDVSQFKQVAQGKVIPLPSGLAVRAKRVDLSTFITSGNVPNPLMEIVTEALEKGQKSNIPEMVGVEEGQVDLEMVNDMYSMVNRVVIASVIEPKVHEVPTEVDVEEWNSQHPQDKVTHPDELRDDDLLYVTEFDDEDKMFIFQWATGGTEDVAQFREEARTNLDALAEIQSNRGKAK